MIRSLGTHSSNLLQELEQAAEQAVGQAVEQAQVIEKKLPNRERAHLRLKFS